MRVSHSFVWSVKARTLRRSKTVPDQTYIQIYYVQSIFDLKAIADIQLLAPSSRSGLNYLSDEWSKTVRRLAGAAADFPAHRAGEDQGQRDCCLRPWPLSWLEADTGVTEKAPALNPVRHRAKAAYPLIFSRLIYSTLSTPAARPWLVAGTCQSVICGFLALLASTGLHWGLTAQDACGTTALTKQNITLARLG